MSSARVRVGISREGALIRYASVDGTDYMHLAHTGEISQNSAAFCIIHACAAQGSVEDFLCLFEQESDFADQPLSVCFRPVQLKLAPVFIYTHIHTHI